MSHIQVTIGRDQLDAVESFFNIGLDEYTPDELDAEPAMRRDIERAQTLLKALRLVFSSDPQGRVYQVLHRVDGVRPIYTNNLDEPAELLPTHGACVCGRRVDEPVEAWCSSCNRVIDPDEEQCPTCGHNHLGPL